MTSTFAPPERDARGVRWHGATIVIAAVAIVAVATWWMLAMAGVARYFPSGALDPSDASSDEFRNRWYSQHLAAMSEPKLVPRAGVRAYRFTWLRTFHSPIAVRVEATKDRVELFATALSGHGGYDPGKPARTTHLELQRAQFDALEASFDRHGFWQLPAQDKAMGFDGARWVIEAATDRYHVVDRWSPERGPVRELGEEFLALAGWLCPPFQCY